MINSAPLFKADHIKPLTAIRGVAALAVVVHHTGSRLLPRWGNVITAHTHLLENGYLWVDFFFILSGFILTHVYQKQFNITVAQKGYQTFLISRLARLYPLHFFTLALMIGLEVIKLIHFNWLSYHDPSQLTQFNQPFHSQLYHIPGIFLNLFMLQVFDPHSPPLFDIYVSWNGPAWSISAEFLIYLLVPFLIFFLLQRKAFASGLLYMLAFSFICIVLEFNKLNNSGFPSLIRCGSECVAGILTYKAYVSGFFDKFLKSDLSFISITLSVLIVMHYAFVRVGVLDPSLYQIIPLFCLLILACSLNRQRFSNLLSSPTFVFLGLISYSIYMVHWFILEFMSFAWKVTFSEDFGIGWSFVQASIVVVVIIGAVIAMATCTYTWVELPMRSRVKKLPLLRS